MNIKWNAEEYGKKFAFVHEYGAELFDLIDCKGGAALDLGCGNGALTKRLADAGFEAVGLAPRPNNSTRRKGCTPKSNLSRATRPTFACPKNSTSCCRTRSFTG